MSRVHPVSGTFSRPFSPYIALVTEVDVLPLLEEQVTAVEAALGNLPEELSRFRYAEGKWSVSEVVGHVVDCERVFGYRALATARGERIALPSFDENAYASAAGHDACPLAELVAELAALRRSHVLFFRHLPPAAWDRLGMVAGEPNATRSWAYLMAGHLRHHANVLRERYGIPVEA